MYQSNSGGPRQMFGAGLAVGALQVGIGVALLSTFAGGTITRVIRQHLDGNKWTYVPPPQHRADPVRHTTPTHHQDTMVTSRSPTSDPINPDTITNGAIALTPLTLGDDLGRLTDFPLHPPTPPQMPAMGAHPLGDPGMWITPEDYPYRALREGWRGVTRLHLVIDGNGHVSSCTITASSGHDALDAVACAKVSQRAHFSPARDGTGAARDGSYDNAIHWEIHEEPN